MEFGNILSKAWKTTWKYKILWLFGILASLGQGGSGGGGGGGGNYQSGNNFSNDFNFNPGELQGVPPELQQGLTQFADFMSSIQWWWIVIVILILLVISLVVWAISLIGKTALIKGTAMVDDGAEKLSFGELFSGSLKYFWRVLLYSLLTGTALFVLMLVVLTPLILVSVFTAGIGALCIIPLLCVLVPFMWLVSIYIEQSFIAIVVENVGVIAGLKLGWAVVKKNFWNLVLMSLALGIGASVVGFIIALPLLLVFVPPAISAIGSAMNSTFDWEGLKNSLILSGALCCVFYPIFLVANGVLTTFVQSAWTYTYLGFTIKTEPELDVIVPEVPQVEG